MIMAVVEWYCRNQLRPLDTNGMMPYERFEAWKATHELALEVYRITELWPRSERYELTGQTRRAALSAPTNIAEGASKRGRREFRRYLDIARGSLSELSYLLRFSKDRGVLGIESYQHLEGLRERAGKITWGLYASLTSAKPS
jgi:four helix bundle protein